MSVEDAETGPDAGPPEDGSAGSVSDVLDGADEVAEEVKGILERNEERGSHVVTDLDDAKFQSGTRTVHVPTGDFAPDGSRQVTPVEVQKPNDRASELRTAFLSADDKDAALRQLYYVLVEDPVEIAYLDLDEADEFEEERGYRPELVHEDGAYRDMADIFHERLQDELLFMCGVDGDFFQRQLRQMPQQTIQALSALDSESQGSTESDPSGSDESGTTPRSSEPSERSEEHASESDSN